MKYNKTSLDYFQLLKDGVASLPEHAKKIRIAIMADCAVQQLSSLFKILAARYGVDAQIFEGDYDSIDLEILNPQSQLYDFDPQYLILIMSAEKLKSRLYESKDRSNFAVDAIARLENLWLQFSARCQATIIQSTFVLPSDRAFGNYEFKVADSVGSIFAEINHQIAVKSRAAKSVLLADIDFLAASIGREQWQDARL